MEIEFDNINDISSVIIKDQNGQELHYDLLEQLAINEHDMHSEFRNQPGKYVYWATILERVKAQVEAAVFREEQVFASLYEPARLQLIGGGTTRPTKDQIESEIIQTDEYIEVHDEVLKLKALSGKMNRIVRALEQRADMLMQIGASQRKQQDYERNINSI